MSRLPTSMDEITDNPPPRPPCPSAEKRPEGSSVGLSRAKRNCSSFAVSVQEGFRYVKAILLGQAKKMTAKNEAEATEADMQTYKMQVDAANAAEDAKNKLDKAA